MFGFSKALNIMRLPEYVFCFAVVLLVQPRVEAAEPANFTQILKDQTRQSFLKISQYVAKNPQADDIELAHRWLFQTAMDHGLEAEAVNIAVAYLKRESVSPQTASFARKALCLGLVRDGKVEEAQSIFEDHLAGIRLRSADSVIDFSLQLARQAQLVGEYKASKNIYEAVSGKFFLSPHIREICDNKIEKLTLIGQPAPKIGAHDIAGNRVDLNDYKGKVVLIDFWATNCPPCLEEFPRMKQLYDEYHADGFEIIGISFDTSQGLVEEFQKKWELPWRMVLLADAQGSLRRPYKVATIPSMYLIGRDGNVVQFDLRSHHLRQAVSGLMDRKK